MRERQTDTKVEVCTRDDGTNASVRDWGSSADVGGERGRESGCITSSALLSLRGGVFFSECFYKVRTRQSKSGGGSREGFMRRLSLSLSLSVSCMRHEI